MLIMLTLRLVALVCYIAIILIVQVFTLVLVPFRICIRTQVETVTAAELEKFLAERPQVLVMFNNPMCAMISGTSILMSLMFSSFAASSKGIACIRCPDMPLAQVKQLVTNHELLVKLTICPQLCWFPLFALFKHGATHGCSSGSTYTTTADLKDLTLGKSRSSDDQMFKIGVCGGP